MYFKCRFLTNLIYVKDVKCSGNWMWAAKLPGEGACLWDACNAMCEVMGQLGVAIDGGKDSLSMAARVGKETVKAPGISAFTRLCFQWMFLQLMGILLLDQGLWLFLPTLFVLTSQPLSHPIWRIRMAKVLHAKT